MPRTGKLRGKNETIAELQAAMLEGARRSSEVQARAGRECEALQERLVRVEAARAKELAGMREVRPRVGLRIRLRVSSP